MLKGENCQESKCPDCGVVLEIQVLISAAGYYLGTMCDCGPYSRESGYFPKRDEAEVCLREWKELEAVSHVAEEPLPHQRTTAFNPAGLKMKPL